MTKNMAPLPMSPEHPLRRRVRLALGSGRWRAIGAVVGSVVVVMGTAIVAVMTRPSAKIIGSYLTSVVSGSDPAAEALWSRTHGGSPLPWSRVAVLETNWSFSTDHVDRYGECHESLFVFHPPEWQLTARDDAAFSIGEMHRELEQLAERHPEFVATEKSTGHGLLPGSQLSRPLPSAADVGQLQLMFQVPDHADPDFITAGVAVTCGSNVAGFSWLRR